MASLANTEHVVPESEVKRLIKEGLQSVGTPRSHAELVAEVLAAADRRGHYSHGLNRLELYLKEIKAGVCNPSAIPEVLKESPSTAWVDGCNGLGFVVGDFCMKLALKKAKETGVGWVVAKNSNHFGICGWYPMMASKEGMIGMSGTNASPYLVPTRARKPMVGTNPISMASPGKGKDDFVLDMANTSVALGKMELKRRAGVEMPAGWGVDQDGMETQDPAVAIDKGGLTPLGGSESSSGYKGYGLSMMMDIFCGILGGGTFGPHIRKYGDLTADAGLSQCFMAIDPKCFAPGFEDRLGCFMLDLRSAEPSEKGKPVLVAGDPEKAHEKEVERVGGIPYHSSLITAMEQLAAEWKLNPLKTLN